ncbi:MAG TPA: nucleotidyltransferase domain-containing protein [Nanoarchaeota archaeon]|nr:nucleotidyltransferase domain-containing protein [Nanoarchaeota archaeon]
MVQLIELIGNKKQASLIVFFIRHPTMKIHQQDIKKEVKIAKATLIKWLNMLANKGMIGFAQYGRTKIYSLNRENTIIKRLKVLDNFLLVAGVKAIAEKHDSSAYLFGSAARGEDAEDSDIDILLIGKVNREDIIRDINKISEKIQRNINVQIFSPLEWSQMAKKDAAFYERVEKDKVEL